MHSSISAEADGHISQKIGPESVRWAQENLDVLGDWKDLQQGHEEDVPNLCQAAPASWQGDIAGRCTVFASHVACLVMDRGALEGKSVAVLFVDAKSAFHSSAQMRVLGAHDQVRQSSRTAWLPKPGAG